ncbi:glycosyltransferase [Pelosinus propionicus]|uniref:Glycosyl transferase family 2 n=1 Tax=Pelosinus propionicus DSM 13327 TaxID=1123291 RepID=A0A1I4IPS9_9FIRM|nr:glycosyltransferase [Pelosinus propionicus]SFL56304.1 Glycosyl transferase family 2 [Pelosinus propionicus DSM 13327]
MDCTIKQLFDTFLPIYRKKEVSELVDNPDSRKCFMRKLREICAKEVMKSTSIVTCTNKPHCMDNIFQNYQNQVWGKKELIIILNRDDIDRYKWEKKAENYKNVYIYQVPQEKSLGYCYNFSIKKANYDYIATFDDDDYYAPNYLTDLMHAFLYTDADIVGKLTYYTYLEEKRLLILRNPFQEYRYLDDKLSFLDGGKKIIKRKVFDHVQFRDISNLEDVYMSQDCMKKGFKIFSTDKYNITYMRNTNKDNHTWKENDDKILSWGCSIIGQTNDYKTSVII